MPQAFANFVYYIYEGLVAIGFSEAAAIAIVDYGIKIAATAALSAAYAKVQGTPDFSGVIEGTTITTRETIAHQRIVLGEVLVSGPIAPIINSAGESNKELHIGVVMAGHRVHSIGDIWLDTHAISCAQLHTTTGAVLSGDFRGDPNYAPCAFFKKFDGSQTTAPTSLNATFAEITSDHIGHNIAWMHSRFDFFEGQTQVWSAGSPVNVRALVKGALVYDPRSDSTQPFGVGPHRVNSEDTYEWSANPALHWAWYMVNTPLGFAIPYEKIDYGYVASAANICDGIVYTPVGTSRRFECHGILSTGDEYGTNIERILSSFNGTSAQQGGIWKVRAWSWEEPEVAVTDDMVTKGGIQINLDVPEDDRYNVVRGYFVDPDRNWQANQFPNAVSSEYLARDGGKKLYKDIQLHMTKDVYMAQRLAYGLLEQSDNQVTVVFPGNYKVIAAEVGGTVKYSNNKMEYDEKPFRVLRYKFTGREGIGLYLREDSADKYVDVGTAEYSTVNQASYALNAPGAPPPTSLTAESRLEGINLKATPPAARLYDYMRFYSSASNDRDQANEIARVRGDTYFFPVNTQTNQYFWARAENYLGRLSDYYPNSQQTGVYTIVSSAVGMVFSESNADTTISSDWSSATQLASVVINPGGDFNFRVDVTAETMLYHKAPMQNTPVTMRVRHAVGTPSNWNTIGAERQSVVNSVSPDWATLKRNIQSNVNTNHYFDVQAIAAYSQSSEWIANSYTNITAKLVPQARYNISKVLRDSIRVEDSVVAERTADSLTLTISATNVSASVNGFPSGGRVPASGYAFTTTTASGGVPPYTWAWEKISDADGDNFVISNSGTANAGWYGNREDTHADNIEEWRATVTDSGAVNSAQRTITVQLQWNSIS